MTFRPRLTKYCRGCVPGIPGGVDAYAVTQRSRRPPSRLERGYCPLSQTLSPRIRQSTKSEKSAPMKQVID